MESEDLQKVLFEWGKKASYSLLATLLERPRKARLLAKILDHSDYSYLYRL